MKKIIFFGFMLSSMVLFFSIKTKAFNVGDEYYDMLIKEDLKDYSKKLEDVSNTTYIGEYYKVGIMGHRKVVEVGEFKGLKYVVISSGEPFQVGSVSGIEKKETNIHEVEKTTISTKRITLGISQIISAALNFLDFASVGKSSTASIEYTYENTKIYSDKTITETSTTVTYDLSKVIPGQTTVSIGQVALVAEFAINSSYTQEQNMFGKWGKMNNTEVKDYVVTYIVTCVTTFVYQKGFGTTKTNYYPFGLIDFN